MDQIPRHYPIDILQFGSVVMFRSLGFWSFQLRSYLSEALEFPTVMVDSAFFLIHPIAQQVSHC